MYYVYILKSEKVKRFYIGSTANPEKRLAVHNAGRVRSTKPYKPWTRIYLEQCNDKCLALKIEKYLKSGWGRQSLDKILEGWRSPVERA